jgi:hypothetical protein
MDGRAEAYMGEARRFAKRQLCAVLNATELCEVAGPEGIHGVPATPTACSDFQRIKRIV